MKNKLSFVLVALLIVVLLGITIKQELQLTKQQEEIDRLKIQVEVIYIDFYK